MTRYQGLLRLSLLAATAGLLAGCNVGPKYVRPNVTAPSAFRGADNAAITSDVKNSFGDEQWAAVYREPELQELIRKALANNYDVRIAARRILEQQAASQDHPLTGVPKRYRRRHRDWRKLCQLRLALNFPILSLADH